VSVVAFTFHSSCEIDRVEVPPITGRASRRRGVERDHEERDLIDRHVPSSSASAW